MLSCCGAQDALRIARHAVEIGSSGLVNPLGSPDEAPFAAGDGAGRKAMIVAKLIKRMETEVNRFWLMGKSDAETDEMFYDTAKLTQGERHQAFVATSAQTVPEGSIFLVNADPESTGFEVFICTDPAVEGAARAKAVVKAFEEHVAAKKIAIDTVVIPGCGSSPVGAAALGKSVALSLGKPVAAIVAGQGAMDKWCEALSGGMLMGPTAKLLNFFDKPMEYMVKVNPFARDWARSCTRELIDAICEAGTLVELLKGRLLSKTGGGFTLNDAKTRKLDMIVSHSKGNWAVQAALLNFEFDVAERIERPATIDKRIDVVTFGNWVDLPDQDELVKELFHYHQFIGTHDKLAMLNSPSLALAKLLFNMQLDTMKPADHTRDADEMLFFGRDHNLVQSKDDHMPIEKLIPAIRAAS